MECLEVTIEKIIYYNENNHYCVLKCKHERYLLIDVIGNLNNPQPHLNIKAHGEWHEDLKFGKQFKASLIELTLPKRKEDIQKYLSSGRIKGIGEKLAEAIVDKFGTKTLSVLTHEPHKLKQIEGLGKKKIATISDSFKKDIELQESMIFLQSLGVTKSKCEKIFKAYGHSCIEVVKTNPYQLSYDIKGFGFLLCDQIASALHIEKDSPLRIHAAIYFCLEEEINYGHCWCSQHYLTDKVFDKLQISKELITNEYPHLGSHIHQWEHHEEKVLALKDLYQIEQEISHILKKRATSSFKPIPMKECKLDFSPTQEQIDCVKKVLNFKTAVITGGPGVGKTTLVKLILQSLLHAGLQVVLCAPTGRAAKRLYESTGVDSKTIHRLLEYDPVSKGFKKNQHQPIQADCIIIDESSMIDVYLLHSLIKATSPHCQLIFVGDVDQLPSIGPGAILHDLIRSMPKNVIKLTHIFRQARTSMITTNAHRINENKLPIKSNDSDCFIIEIQDPNKIAFTVNELINSRIPNKFGYNPLSEIQILTPSKKGPLGTVALNKHIASSLNPNPVSSIMHNGQQFSTGDKIIVQRNNYEKEIFNGDIGIIKFYENNEFGIEINNRIVRFSHQEIDDISLAYAITIHKSQGSEYPAVIIPLAMSHYMMLNKNLLYTAITRAKKLAIVITPPKAMIMAIKVNSQPTRRTMLFDLFSQLETQ